VAGGKSRGIGRPHAVFLLVAVNFLAIAAWNAIASRARGTRA
jgi:hypothetical protein